MNIYRKYLYPVVAILIFLALVGSSFQVSATAVGAPLQQAGLPTWPSNPDWQSYVPGPSSDDVHAAAITRSHGDVTNPEALLGGGGTTTLTMEEGGPEAVIVLDYGQEVGGTPYLNISNVSGSPSVRISTSEALPFLNSGGNTSLALDASAGDTNVKVEDVSPFFVGTDITVDEGAAVETRTVTDVGTPATTTNLFSAASPGDTNVKVTSVSGLAVGNEIDVEPGPSQEHVTITNIGTAGVATAVSAPNTTGGLVAPVFSDANWIWNTANAQSSAPSGTIYVRKTFNIPDASAVTSAVLGIAVDDEHDTYVNGTLVSSLHISNGWRTFSVADITPQLVDGTNVIAVAATNGSGAGSMLAAFDIDGSHNVSDTSWKALPGTPASPPAGWNTAGFDDSSWPAAYVSGLYGIGPWNNNVQPPPVLLPLSFLTGLGLLFELLFFFFFACLVVRALLDDETETAHEGSASPQRAARARAWERVFHENLCMGPPAVGRSGDESYSGPRPCRVSTGAAVLPNAAGRAVGEVGPPPDYGPVGRFCFLIWTRWQLRALTCPRVARGACRE